MQKFSTKNFFALAHFSTRRKFWGAGCSGGFTNINDAVKQYCQFLDEGGYY